MAFDDIKAELGILLTQVESEQRPEDKHELYLQIMMKLNEMRAFGLPLPADLLRMEAALEAEFGATKRDSAG